MAEPYIYNYDEINRMITAVYGEGSDVWQRVQYVQETGQYFGAIDEELANIGVEAVTTPRGRILGYRQKVPLQSSSSGSGAISGNSNYQNAAYANTPAVTTSATATKTTETGRTVTTFEQGAKSVSTGQRVATVGMNVLNTVAVVGIASRLGKAVGQSFYDSGSTWAWDESDWDDLYWRSDGLGKFLLNVLYGVDGENGTMYVDEEALAQAYIMMRDMGALEQGLIPLEAPTVNTYLEVNSPDDLVFIAPSMLPSIPTATISWVQAYAILKQHVTITDDTFLMLQVDTANKYYLFYVANVTNKNISRVSESADYYSLTFSPLTNTTCYAVYAETGRWRGQYGSRGITVGKNYPYYANGNLLIDNYSRIAEGVEGITTDDQATTQVDPNVVDGATRPEVLNQLQQNYPQLFDGAIYQDVPQKDGTMDRHRYVPVPMPNFEDMTKPVTGANHQNNPSVNPQTNTQTLLDTLIDLITTPHTPDDVPDTGTGDTPVVPVPTGSASSLWAVYNPTQAELDSFGSWLWSSNLVEQIKKLFNDPMQAIIGVHKVFASPSTGAAQNIKCGYIDSGVPAAVVTSQYTTIDCGTVNLREYFGNVFDYSPFTEISLYLPFIGIVKLDVTDVMRASIKVKYHVDVITGACLADVVVNRDGSGGVLYQYSGSAIVTYPLSSGSYASALAGVVSIAGGIAATVATGGAAAPALLGAAVGVSHLHSDVQKSGSFSGAAGAMGGKKPYLIISRPQTAMPSSYKHLEGQPTNHYTTLSNCSGYVKVKQVQVKGLNATDAEMDLIKELLLQGVEM